MYAHCYTGAKLLRAGLKQPFVAAARAKPAVEPLPAPKQPLAETAAAFAANRQQKPLRNQQPQSSLLPARYRHSDYDQTGPAGRPAIALNYGSFRDSGGTELLQN